MTVTINNGDTLACLVHRTSSSCLFPHDLTMDGRCSTPPLCVWETTMMLMMMMPRACLLAPLLAFPSGLQERARVGHRPRRREGKTPSPLYHLNQTPVTSRHLAPRR
jgi:hypothetical protein